MLRGLFFRLHLGGDQRDVGRRLHRIHPRLVEPDGLCHELAVPGHHIAEDRGVREGESCFSAGVRRRIAKMGSSQRVMSARDAMNV